ncbi:MAG: SRPBCC family protein [Bergeyella sp.]
MRWIRIVFITVAVLLGIYSLAMYFFADESKNFTVQKEVNYPVDKVFSQFNNFQNFTRWNNYFSASKTMGIDYYQPYEGMGSAISFHDREKNRYGEMFIRSENPGKALKYELFESKKSNPSQIDIRFIPLSDKKTRIVWDVHTPKQPLLKRSVNFWTEDVFVENLDKSMTNLHNLLSSKVEKSNMLASIKYDSMMVENMEGQLLLGVNVSTSNKKDALFRNIVMNHNKVYNYITVDLAKNEDEFGFPVLMTSPGNFKDKEVSYFYGIPLSKRIGITDNNFSFRTVNASKSYVIYYKGDYSGRIGSIQKLLQKAKRDTMRNGEVIQTFVEAPAEGKPVNMKITLPVYR